MAGDLIPQSITPVGHKIPQVLAWKMLLYENQRDIESGTADIFL